MVNLQYIIIITHVSKAKSPGITFLKYPFEISVLRMMLGVLFFFFFCVYDLGFLEFLWLLLLFYFLLKRVLLIFLLLGHVWQGHPNGGI